MTKKKTQVDDFIWAYGEAERYFDMDVITEIHVIAGRDWARVSVIEDSGDEIILT